MCNDCQMKFFYVNNTEKILLKEIESFNNNWYNIKIKKRIYKQIKSIFSLKLNLKYKQIEQMVFGQ